MGLVAKDRQGNIIQAIRPGTATTQAFTGTTATATIATTGTGPRLFRLVATTACHYELGTSPTATTSSTYLPAEVVEHIWLLTTDNIAVIQNTTAGTLYLSEAT